MLKFIHLLSDVKIEDNGTASSTGGFFDPNTAWSVVLRKGIYQLIYVTAAISVIVLIVSGLRYALSAGNPSAVKSARDGILYAVIGLIVAVSGYAIAFFVTGQF